MNWLDILPEIIIAATAAIIIIVDLISRRPMLSTVLAISGIAASMVVACTSTVKLQPLFDGMLFIDGWSKMIRVLLLIVAAGVVIASTDYQLKLKSLWAEYHALVLFALLGMMIMAMASNLISAFVAIEITTISFFILVGLLKNPSSSEAALKMMLTGAIASAVMLYGMAFIFGSTGSTGFSDIALHSNPDFSSGLLLGILLLMVGLFFEAGAVPFHMWIPDTYEGAPTPVTMYLSAGSKVAGIAIIARIFSMAFTHPQQLGADWGIIVAVISAITMTLGNILALQQNNIKRLLAYSGIVHTGYMLIGIATIGLGSQISGDEKLFFYLVAFALAEIAVFSAVIVITRQVGSDNIEDFTGLARRSPVMFATLSIGLFSLMGLPLTAGFMAKLFIFTSAINNGLLWLVIIAVINTVISAYYYLKVVRIMWLGKPSDDSSINLPKAPVMVSSLSGLGLLLLGIAPYLLLKLTENILIIP